MLLSDSNNTPYDASSISTTNWTVAGGSLETSVTFESSFSLINGDEKHDGIDDSSNFASPLILYPPPSADSSTPCEIKITFAQKHEVRQVYVRSTSRVYEIYCNSEGQSSSSSEYLCTVRCGIAIRDDEVLRATGIEETVLAHKKGFTSTKEVAEGEQRNGSSQSSSEDDWVEVKAHDAQLTNGNSSLSSNSHTSQKRNSPSQDLYEATADISDTNPCSSITLKLLSLQDKGFICIDEVYVYADPVDEADLESQKASPMENSNGNSLMAMIIPTFLQLSKMNGAGRALDKSDNHQGINVKKSEKSKEKPPDPFDAGKDIQQKVQLQEKVTPNSKPIEPEETSPECSAKESKSPSITKQVELEVPLEFSAKENKPDNISQNNIEGVLNQLVSRVTRMEDLFLRFEDCMLKPIKSIDERLQKVELQLEVLTKKTQNSGLLSCNRISAPEFSCSESETNSLYNSGCADLSYATCNVDKKDSQSSVSCTQSYPQHPSLVVTAPEFPNFDDEEEEDDAIGSVEKEDDDVAEPAEESLEEKQKHGLSIDEALASALAGFLTSTSTQHREDSKAIVFKAPDFPNEEGNTEPRVVHSQVIKEPLTGFGETDGNEILSNSFSSLFNVSSPGSSVIGRIDENVQHGDENESVGNCFDDDAGRLDSFKRNIDDEKNGQIGNGKSSISDSVDDPDQFSTDNRADNTKESAFQNEQIARKEVPDEEDSNLSFNCSHFISKVDFETPILEVKFTSQGTMNPNSPLEALLAGIPDLNSEASLTEEKTSKNDSENSDDESNLIIVENCWGETSSAAGNHVSLDMDYCDSLTVSPLKAETAVHFI